MGFFDDIGTLIDTILVVVIVTAACLIDVFHNPCHHPRKLVVRRFFNWFLVGITYASTYFGRYNMNVVNQGQTHAALKVTASQFGVVLTVGSASYAVFVVLNGFIVDKIGGKRAMVIGALGSGFFNLVQGLFVQFAVGKVFGSTALALMCIIFACNNFFQTFCTSAICKVAVNWYHLRERGYFSGVFGVIISLGFFFAYQVIGVIYAKNVGCEKDKFSPWVYFVPAIQLTVFGLLNWAFAVDTPADAGFTYDPLTLTDSAGESTEASSLLSDRSITIAKKKRPSLKTLFMTVFGNPIFIVLCLIDICLGWNRDGVLGWFPEVLSARFGCTSSSNQFALASGGTTIAGMFGSLGAGMLSDSLFHSRRPPVALCFYIGLAINITALFFVKVGPNSGWIFAFLIAFCSVWLNGLNGLITSTCAMDFAGTDATATAVGLLDGIQKIGSSASGVMGAILSPIKGAYSGRDQITDVKYQNWVFCFLPPAAFAISLCFFILDRKAESKPAPKHEQDTCVPVPTPTGEPAAINTAVDDHKE